MLPARALTQQAVKVKTSVAEIKHISAPLKGLSLSSKLTAGDPLTAPILENFIVEEDKIRCRPGTRLAHTHAANKPIEALIPHYGGINEFAFATNGEIVQSNGTVIKTGFTSNDWHWTSFSNLSAVEYTIIVNGKQGVWSWDGSATSTNPAPVAVTSLSKGNPATCTVAAGDIAKFKDGDVVLIAGATGTGLVNANGYKTIYSVNNPPNTFTLAGVDTSTATAPQTTGVTADPQGTGMVQEVVTSPAHLPHINTGLFNIVVSHMNRLWFADPSNLSVYYLPLQQKAGMVTELPLNSVFRRGGNIRAMATWTVDGGAGLDDKLVIFSSNGECVIYSGIDPDSDFNLEGIFRFDSPMSKNGVTNYGGELWVLISTGLVPMTTLMREESEQLGKQDNTNVSHFNDHAQTARNSPGWGVALDHSTGRVICNLPVGNANNYHQLVRLMPRPAWSKWAGLPSRCWLWIDNRIFFGSDDGRIYEMNPNYLSDQDNMGALKPIRVDVQPAWNAYGSSAVKQFKMVLPYIISDGIPKPYVDFRVDYNTNVPYNQPDVTEAVLGATWDEATWDVDEWAGEVLLWNNWQGVSAIGRVGAPRIVAYISNCQFSIAGFDVLFETGGVFG